MWGQESHVGRGSALHLSEMLRAECVCVCVCPWECAVPSKMDQLVRMGFLYICTGRHFPMTGLSMHQVLES